MSRVIAPEDVDTVLRHPLTMMGTDTYALDGRLDPAMALHPRNHGAFARFLARYVRERVVFGRPIGTNQGLQFPLAQAHIAIEAADLMRWRAADLFDAGQKCGAEANMAKYLAAEANWAAANACLDTLGGFGFAAEYDVERKVRETRLYRVAPISQNLVLAFVGQHVLGLPRSC